MICEKPYLHLILDRILFSFNIHIMDRILDVWAGHGKWLVFCPPVPRPAI